MKKILMALALSAAIIGCGSDDSGSGGTGNSDAAALLFPEQNSECTTGVVTSETQSTVTFKWDAAPDTESYFVYVKNLDTQATLQYNASTNTSMAITLNKATPYSWYVSANKADKSVNSETWKFYNAGDGVTSYAPFPADLVAPAMSSSVGGPSVNLQWATTDLDNDIVNHKIYLDTNASPTTLLGTYTTQTTTVTVTAGSTYYWKVVTTDALGNTVTSPIYQFKVL